MHSPAFCIFCVVSHLMDFPGGSVVKNSPANAGDGGIDPWVGKIPWRRK